VIASNTTLPLGSESLSPTSRNKAFVAELSNQDISGMTREEMIAVIRAAQLPFLESDSSRRLEFLSDEALQRLVHLSRRCCRNQGY